MTAQAIERSTRLDQKQYEAKIESVCIYVEQVERADQQADTGSLQRATDLTDLYEDEHWVEEWLREKPIKARRRPGDFQEEPNSRPRFYAWAKKRIASPTTGNSLSPAIAKELLDTEEVARCIRVAALTLPEGVGRSTLKPLKTLVKNKREADIPRVWQRALIESDGASPGRAKVEEAVAEYKKAVDWKTGAAKRQARDRLGRIKREFDAACSDRQLTKLEVREVLQWCAQRFEAQQHWASGAA